MVGPMVSRGTTKCLRDLLRGHYLRRDRVGELAGMPARLRVVPPGPASPGEPLVLTVRNDDLPVGELDLEAGTTVQHLGGRYDGHRPPVRPEQPISDGNLTHGRPPGGCRQGGTKGQRLPDGRAGRYDDHLARVEAVGERVEVAKPGRHAGHHAAPRAYCLDLVQRARHDFGQRKEVLADPALGDPVDLGLGPVHQIVGVPVAGVSELHDPGARLHQAAQDRPLPDDPGVVPGVGRRRHRGEQRVQVGAAPDARQVAALGQEVTDGNRVGRFAAAVEFEDRLVYELMGGPVVVLRADHFQDVGDGVLGHQHPAEYALLGGQVVRWGTLELPASRSEFGDAHTTYLPALRTPGGAPATALHIPFYRTVVTV